MYTDSTLCILFQAIATLEDGRGCMPRNADGLQKPKQARKHIIP